MKISMKKTLYNLKFKAKRSALENENFVNL